MKTETYGSESDPARHTMDAFQPKYLLRGRALKRCLVVSVSLILSTGLPPLRPSQESWDRDSGAFPRSNW